MIRAIIIEDEQRAMEVMSQILSNLSVEVTITAKLRTVSESIQYFLNENHADIIFSDVQLTDGLSFEIFKQAHVPTPVIFTTGFDQYLLSAFENNGIDYLLKPVEKASVEKAILKYKNLRQHFQQYGENGLATKLATIGNAKKRTRIIVKKGAENILLRLEDIILFYTENKVVYVIDRFQKKYLSDKNLSELEADLDDDLFFRVNRKFIVNVNYVKGYKPFEKVKLMVHLNIPDLDYPIIVSQETAPLFRTWIRDA